MNSSEEGYTVCANSCPCLFKFVEWLGFPMENDVYTHTVVYMYMIYNILFDKKCASISRRLVYNSGCIFTCWYIILGGGRVIHYILKEGQPMCIMGRVVYTGRKIYTR